MRKKIKDNSGKMSRVITFIYFPAGGLLRFTVIFYPYKLMSPYYTTRQSAFGILGGNKISPSYKIAKFKIEIN